MNPDRLSRLSEQISAQRLDCLALVPGANLLYFTGLSLDLSDRPMVAFLRPGRPLALVLPALEAAKAEEIAGAQLFPWTDEEGYRAGFERAGAELELGGARIGVEAFTMRLVEMDLLEQCAPGCQILPADEVASALRMCKDAAELGKMRRAADLAQDAMRTTLDSFRPGMTERELETLLKISMLEAGAENVSFAPIVSGGPHSASPHAHPSDRQVGPGEFLLIDCGVYVDGYASDITRTFPVGEMEPEMCRIYELVQEANARGRGAVRPGATCGEVDYAARRVIEAGGYGDQFIHRTGHGLGLQVHEPPFIVAGNPRMLKPGMTFTIEPGIYLAGRGGVRIEDAVVVTERGAEDLTTFGRDWTPIGQ